MLKKRIIGVIVVRDGISVQSIGFNRYLPIGSPAVSVENLNRWGIDEIILLDISATPTSSRPNFSELSEYSRHCQVPLAIGGGIKCVEDITKVIYAGADKVVINTAAVETPEIISDGAKHFGSQCIVVSIDARKTESGDYEVLTNSAARATGKAPVALAKQAEELGAGEIFINSIDRDGAKSGFDAVLISLVSEAVNIPVIACGGAGKPSHFMEIMGYNLSGIAAANFFNFSEHSVIVTKSFLKKMGANVRLDSYATYNGFDVDFMERAGKKDDSILDKMRFDFIPEEII